LHATWHVNVMMHTTWKYAGLLLSQSKPKLFGTKTMYRIQYFCYEQRWLQMICFHPFCSWTERVREYICPKWISDTLINYFNASWQQWHIVGLWQQRCSVDPNII
jgi:hypothetical protein